MSAIQLLALAEVAAALGFSRERFYKRWKAMVRDHGFPAPVPGCGKRWDPVAIRCWLDRQLEPAAADPADPGARAARRERIERAVGAA